MKYFIRNMIEDDKRKRMKWQQLNDKDKMLSRYTLKS